MSKKGLFYIGFFVVLAVGFYFVMTSLIPAFGEKKTKPVSYIRPFSFINQDGKTITEKDVSGKVYVADYFFTTCTGICPKMNSNMKKVYEALKEEDDFLILSHTSMPETDSAAQLKKFAATLDVNTDKWIFLTGSKDSLYRTARESYTIDDPANNLQSIHDQFIHSQHFALVDKNGDVRKIYDGLTESEVNRLIKDARKLLKQKAK